MDTRRSKLWMEFKGIQSEFISNTIRKYMREYLTLLHVSYNDHFYRICIFVKAIIAYINFLSSSSVFIAIYPLMLS